MKFDELKALAKLGARISLSPDNLPDVGFWQVFQSVWRGERRLDVALSGPVDIRAQTSTVALQGGTAFPAVKERTLGSQQGRVFVAPVPTCTLSATFSLDGTGSLHAVLEFTPPSGQHIRDLLPNLPVALESYEAANGEPLPAVESVLYTEPLEDVRLIFRTHADADKGAWQRAGLNLRAIWRPSAGLLPQGGAALEWSGHVVLPLADGEAASHALRLPWEATPSPPGLYLEAMLSRSPTLWSGQPLTKPRFRLYTPLAPAEALPIADAVSPIMAYAGELGPALGLTGTVSIVGATWDDFSHDKLIVWTREKTSHPLGSFSDVMRLGAKLFGADVAPSWNGPSQLSPTAFKLQRIVLRQEKERLAFAAITVELEGAALNVGPFGAQFTDVEIALVREPNDRCSVEGILSGRVSAFGAELAASVQVPGLCLEARQTKPLGLTLDDLFSGKGSDGDNAVATLSALPKLKLPNLSLDELTLRVDPRVEPITYAFSMRIGEGLEIPSEAAPGKTHHFPSLRLTLTNERWTLRGSTLGLEGEHAQGMPIGAMLDHLHHSAVENFPSIAPPRALEGLHLHSFELSVGNDGYSLACSGRLPLDGDRALEANLHLEMEREQRVIGGELWIGGFAFSLGVEAGDASHQLVATYSHSGGTGLSLQQVLTDAVGEFPAALKGFDIALEDAVFALSKSQEAGAKTKLLFGVDLSVQIDLGKLPLVGESLRALATDGVELRVDPQILYATQPLTVSEVQRFNRLLPEGVHHLPENSHAEPGGASDRQADAATRVALSEGIHWGARFRLPGFQSAVSFPAADLGAHGPAPAHAAQGEADEAQETIGASQEIADSATWLSIDKTLGPVHLGRVGLRYDEQKLWVLFGASLTGGGLTVSLDGLTIRAPLGSPFDIAKVDYSLRGLGIEYRNDAVEIAGAFRRMPTDPPQYDGAAILKAQGLTLSAFGSYTRINGEPSLFVYAVLDHALGGPSFFFVTDLAAGFGYDRTLRMPSIEKVADFSLIQAAMNPSQALGTGHGSSASKTPPVLERLSQDVRPAAGQHFLAAGVKFTSFKMVESFALLTVEFGSRLEVHILGLSKLTTPARAVKQQLPRVAEVELALRGSYVPAAGVLELKAQLTPSSYLLSEACHLSGGFAFSTWFAPSPHADDFVLTLGGYHPHFRRPEHYPQVPRLSFHWQVDPELTLKGDAYFALTASALMAGGHLDADWQSGSVHAWFKFGVDFLMAWQPYYYEASAYVNMGMEVTFELFGTQHLTLDLGADLSIWGPDFSGEATIHLWIVSIPVKFGAGRRSKPDALDWVQFKASCLSSQQDLCTLTVADGLVRRREGAKDLGVLNGKHFSLVTECRIPSKTAYLNGVTIDAKGANGSFGVAPMGLAARDLASSHTITIRRVGTPPSSDNLHQRLEWTPIFMRVPAALWGERLEPNLDGPQLIDDVLTGFELRAKAPQKPRATAAIARNELLSGIGVKLRPLYWEAERPPWRASKQSDGRTVLRSALADEKAAAKRAALLTALGFDPERDVELDASVADAFAVPPEIESAA